MHPRIFIFCLLIPLLVAGSSARASWQNFGSYSAADFLNAHVGLVAYSDSAGPVERVVDNSFSVVFRRHVTQIAIQDSNRAWATDGDSLYLGTEQWYAWKTILGQPSLTLVRATPSTLFVYSNGYLYTTVGDTMLTAVQGIRQWDSVTAIDYLSESRLIAVSIFNDDPQQSSVYLSTDGGADWNLVLSGVGNAASVFADRAHGLVFIGGDTLRVSGDSGVTWSAVVPPPEFGIYSFTGQVYGANDCSGTFYFANSVIYGTNTDILRSQDGGNTFEGVGPTPFIIWEGPATKGWVFDRGSTVFWGLLDPTKEFDIVSSYDGVDGLISDSVYSALAISVDTISDTLCAVSSVPFKVSVASSVCTGVQIDAITVVHSSGNISNSVRPVVLFGNGTTFSLTYSGKSPGEDSIVLRLLFHSLEWGFEEHIDFPVTAFSATMPALLEVPDSLSFGEIPLFTSERRTLAITNPGCATLIIDSVVSSNPSVFSLSQLPFPLYVKRGATTNIGVTFSPVTAGPALEALELGSSAGHTFIELEGSGESVAAVSDQQPDKISVFPDPATSYINVLGVDDGAPYAMTDVLGRNVQSGIIQGHSISLSPLPEGIYMLRCSPEGATQPSSVRILISRK